MEDLWVSDDEVKSEQVSKKSKPITRSKIFSACVVGFLSSCVIAVLVVGTYNRFIRFPEEQQLTDKTKTGIHCLEEYTASLKTMDSTGEDSYIHKEIEYANGNEERIAFYKKVLGTISYTPLSVKGTNVYGNGLVDDESNLRYSKSWVDIDEPVLMGYVDYNSIPLDKDKIATMLQESGLVHEDVDYHNKLVDVFCKYINSLEELPIRVLKRVPNIEGNLSTGYKVTSKEDEFIDKLLFSSNDFYRLLDKFSTICSAVGTDSSTGYIEPTEEWLEWNSTPLVDRVSVEEPGRYNWKDVVSKDWCGTYYLQNEIQSTDTSGKKVKGNKTAEVGEGTFENPAGLNTDVVTSMFSVDGDGNEVEYPIRVKLTDFGVSTEAIKWLEAQDPRNRGKDVSSELQYCFLEFEVTNLSDKDLIIYDNSALCDKNANITSRTGEMFGMVYEVRLKPDESGTIKTWCRSTELNKQYVIWGRDFKRRADPIWFRFLAGDIDDESENKGVEVNNSRLEENESKLEEEEKPEDVIEYD